nr:MAG TPA: hypothetical protein [Bacteriophage sp.]
MPGICYLKGFLSLNSRTFVALRNVNSFLVQHIFSFQRNVGNSWRNYILQK